MLNRIISLSFSVFLLTGMFFFAMTKQAHAYIDVGTGSMILQGLLAGIFGSMFAIKVFWAKVTQPVARFFSRFSSDK